jgi:hypothetical protein
MENQISRHGLFWGQLLPLLIGTSLLLSICTFLRLDSFPVGPGESLLALLALLGLAITRKLQIWKHPLVLFWLVVLITMGLGYLTGNHIGLYVDRTAMAYGFTGFVSIGMLVLFQQLSNQAIRRSLFWLCVSTAILLWLGFSVYISGNLELLHALKMQDCGDTRYCGWSVNPNQLALFFIPLPVWVAALWRDITKPTPMQIIGFGLLLFALMLMGLLVRSDGLFVVWVFEFVVLLALRLRWDMKVGHKSLLGYGLTMVLCVLLVKTFAHGEVRKSVICASQTLAQGINPWKAQCYDGQAFKDQEALRIGYSDPADKVGTRQDLWKNGLKAWLDAPLFGHGPGWLSWNTDPNSSESIPTDPNLRWESHNISIDFLTQGGIFLGLSWVALVGHLLLGAWKIRDSYSFSVVLMMAVFTFFHNTRQPYFWFVLMIANEAIRRKLFVSNSSAPTS